MVEIDYQKLRGRIIEKCGTVRDFGKMLGVTDTTIYLKMSKAIDFRYTDIVKAAEILDIPPEEIHLYFFTKKLTKNES